MRKLTTDDLYSFLKTNGEHLSEWAREGLRQALNENSEQAFANAIEIGIENTFFALYDAGVDDKKILHVVCDNWGITIKDAEDRLIWTKQQSAIRVLKQYLKLQGLSEIEIKSFMQEHYVAIKIRHNKDLWKHKNNPEKLLQLISNNNDS